MGQHLTITHACRDVIISGYLSGFGCQGTPREVGTNWWQTSFYWILFVNREYKYKSPKQSKSFIWTNQLYAQLCPHRLQLREVFWQKDEHGTSRWIGIGIGIVYSKPIVTYSIYYCMCFTFCMLYDENLSLYKNFVLTGGRSKIPFGKWKDNGKRQWWLSHIWWLSLKLQGQLVSKDEEKHGYWVATCTSFMQGPLETK